MNMKTHILAKKAAAFMLSVVMLASGAQPALASETVETAEDTVQETEEPEFDSETETISGETAVTENSLLTVRGHISLKVVVRGIGLGLRLPLMVQFAASWPSRSQDGA